MPGKDTRRERDVTDASLRDERSKTDEELTRQRADIENDGDAGVARARASADHAVRLSREAADAHASRTTHQDAQVSSERRREDDLLAREREIVDEQRDLERADRHRVIAALLAAERDSTDANLRDERRIADAAITAREDVLSRVSHDLRSLMAGVLLNAQLLQVRGATDDPSEVTRRAAAIERSSRQLSRLIDDLMDLTSLDAGQLRLAVETVDASSVVDETLEVFGPAAAAHGIVLTGHTARGELLAHCDRGRILQVLGNLVGNAIKFTRPEGTIEISAAPHPDGVLFSITDTGPGIADEHRGAIFERFWQTRTAKQPGVGLGLYLAKCIVEAHHGRIWVESEVGRGSIFYFTVPAASS